MAAMPVLTSAHDAVLALFDLLPEDIEADADLVAGLLGVLQAEAARLLDQLETAGTTSTMEARGPFFAKFAA
jgi:hypothetical protein